MHVKCITVEIPSLGLKGIRWVTDCR